MRTLNKGDHVRYVSSHPAFLKYGLGKELEGRVGEVQTDCCYSTYVTQLIRVKFPTVGIKLCNYQNLQHVDIKPKWRV